MKVGERAGMSLVEYGIVGTVLLISVGMNLLLVFKLMKVQDKRVEDKEKDNERLERLTTNTTEVLAKVSAAVTGFERSDRDGAAILQGVKNSLDTIVMQAVMRGMTPQGMPRVRPEELGR